MEQLKKAWHNHIAISMQNTQESVEQNTIQNDITKQKEQENNNKDTMLQRLQEKEKLQKFYNNEIQEQIALHSTKAYLYPKYILEKNLLYIYKLINEAQNLHIVVDSALIESVRQMEKELESYERLQPLNNTQNTHNAREDNATLSKL